MAKPKKDQPADAKPKKKSKKPKPAVAAAEPVFTAEPVDPPVAGLTPSSGLTPRGLLDRLSGARLCYGEPVTGGDLTIVPVARVRVAGGFGGDSDEGGGGGAVQATPVGYIEVGGDGARFRTIDDPDRTLRIVQTVAVTAAAALGAAAALRNLTR